VVYYYPGHPDKNRFGVGRVLHDQQKADEDVEVELLYSDTGVEFGYYGPRTGDQRMTVERDAMLAVCDDLDSHGSLPRSVEDWVKKALEAMEQGKTTSASRSNAMEL
jgi:hypothetical protein